MALQINVYDELKNGCYVCPPSTQMYTWGEMEEMLSNTKVSLEELRELYESYHGMAAEKIYDGLLAERFIWVDDKNLEFDDSLKISIPAKSLFAKVLAPIGIAMVIFFSLGLGCYELFLALSMNAYIGMLVEILLFLLVFIGMGFRLSMLCDSYVTEVEKREKKLKKFFRAKVTTHLTNRYGTVVVIFNTMMMYQLLEEKLKEAQLV